MNPKQNFQGKRYAAKIFLAATLLLSGFVFHGNGVAGTGRFESQKTEQHFQVRLGSPRTAYFKFLAGAAQARSLHFLSSDGIKPTSRRCNQLFDTLFSRLSRDRKFRPLKILVSYHRPRSATEEHLILLRV